MMISTPPSALAVVTQAQADALRTFSRQRQKIGVAERADEERFRFMRGFNDFFFAVGVVLFGAGIAMYASMHPESDRLRACRGVDVGPGRTTGQAHAAGAAEGS